MYGLTKRAPLLSESQLAELLSRYQKQITNHVFKIVDNYALAEDIAQETFVQVYYCAPVLTHPQAYIYRTATNLALIHLRRREHKLRTVQMSAILKPRAGEESRDYIPVDASLTPDAAFFNSEAIAYALAGLSKKARVIFLMRHDEGLSYEEIAAALRIPLGTAKGRVNKARTAMLKRLAVWEGKRGRL